MQVHGGGGDQFPKEWADGGGGDEVAPGRAANPFPTGAIVADLRVVERELHEPRETEAADGPGGGAEGGQEGRRDGGG